MGKKNKSGQDFSPHNQGKRDSGGGGFKEQYKGKFTPPGFQRGKQQGKPENVANKDKNFNEKFEQKQHDKTAVSLKNEVLTPQQKKFETNGTANKKNIKCNDGLSAVHVPIKQELNSGNIQEKQKQSVKRKFSSSSDSDMDEIETNKKAKRIDELAVNGGGGKKVSDKIESSNSAITSSNSDVGVTNNKGKHEPTPAINGKKRAFLDESDDSVESDIDDEEGDDLEETADLDDAAMEDEQEDEELTELDSFITDEEELEDEDEEDDISSDEDESIPSSIDLNILGFKAVKENANCLILQAEGDYSIATSPFKLHKFSSSQGLPNDHSVQVALRALKWLLNPIDSQLFFSTIFQKRVLVVKRSASSYYDKFFDVRAFTKMIQDNFLEYGKDLNVASYVDGRRLTHNPTIEGLRVTPAEIAAQLAKGHSIQCVHPQVFNDHIWYICEILQEVFCSFVGANNYLTPASSAGFAPHWDDIDAFMLQVEGKKYWKVYAPENAEDTLPLDSSQNFTDDDFKERKPVFEGWLEQGNLLYVPRGFVHQAKTGAEMHSHHVTISVCRHHSYADFFENASVEFIKMLTSKSKRLRLALPTCLLDMDGAVKMNYSNQEAMDKSLLPIAEIFARKFGSDFSAFVPSFIDLMAKEFFKTALPPLLSAEERELSCFGGPKFDLMNGPVEIGGETEVRLIRKHTQRLLIENENHQFIVHRVANSRRYDESQVESIVDFPNEFQRAFITLADSYPKWTKVRELGLDEPELNIKTAKLLFDNGLLLRKQSTKEVGGGKKGNQQEKAKTKDEKKKKKDNVEEEMEEEEEEGGTTAGDESSIMVNGNDDGGNGKKQQKKKRAKKNKKNKNKFAAQNKE